MGVAGRSGDTLKLCGKKANGHGFRTWQNKEEEMKNLMTLMFISVFLFGCAEGNKLNIVSPSMSEDETKERAKAILHEKKETEKQPEPSEQPVSTKSVAPQSAENGRLAQEGLVNLLIKKGVISQKELEEEIEKLKTKSGNR